MARTIGMALGSYVALLGGQMFAVHDFVWRQDNWSEWRNDWPAVFMVEEHHPFLFVCVGLAIVLFAATLAKPEAS